MCEQRGRRLEAVWPTVLRLPLQWALHASPAPLLCSSARSLASPAAAVSIIRAVSVICAVSPTREPSTGEVCRVLNVKRALKVVVPYVAVLVVRSGQDEDG